MKSLVRFETGTQDEYESSVKYDNVLYYITDTKRIYKGSVEYTKTAKVVENLPSIDDGEFGVIYINSVTCIPYVYTGTSYVPIIKLYSTVIDDNATDDTIPTTAAVKSYVDNKIRELNI